MNRYCLLVALTVAVSLAWGQADRQRARRLYEQKDFAGAAAALSSHLKKSPDDRDSRVLLGMCLHQLGRNNDAEQVFRESIARNAKDHQAHYYLALTEYLQGKLLEAEADARESIALGASPARSLYLIARSREEQNRLDEALAVYLEAIGKDSSYADAHLGAGRVCLKLQRAAEAVEHLQAAVRLGHTEAARLLARAQAARFSGAKQPAPPQVRFNEIAAESGLNFVLNNHGTPAKHLIETMAGGVAAFDYNNDGLTDVFFTNGAETPSLRKTGPRYFNRLFRNDGGMKFTDVTASAGVEGNGFAIGATAADFDNDGHADLFVAGYRVAALYRNVDGGRFVDVSARAGIRADEWSVAGGWFDYDNDGWLDLFVVNYLDWSPSDSRFCGDPAAGIRTYCHPRFYKGTANRLYRNKRDGTFEDVSMRSGIAAHVGKGMSVAFADYDSDGLMDVFVTNDRVANFLFRNRGDGTFEERAMESGSALNDNGDAVSAMGVDFRDYNNDGLPDLIYTALAGETFPLLRNRGRGAFEDRTWADGIGILSGRMSGWHVSLADFNNDGWKDVFTANSHVTDNIEMLSTVEKYLQANSLWLNAGDGRFVDGSSGAGTAFSVRRAHRGGVVADFDNDGKLDAVVTSLAGPAELWHNISPDARHWVRFQLEGRRSNRDGIGAKIQVDGQANLMTTSSGYASGVRSGVHFGLGPLKRPVTAEILWPSGLRQTINDVEPDRIVTVREPVPQ